MRAQLPRGSQARLADVILPGATLQVDVPMSAAEPAPAPLDLDALARDNPAIADALRRLGARKS